MHAFILNNFFVFTECPPKYGPLLVTGLFIVTLVELLGLIYMKWLGKSALFCYPLSELELYNLRIPLLLPPIIETKECIIDVMTIGIVAMNM